MLDNLQNETGFVAVEGLIHGVAQHRRLLLAPKTADIRCTQKQTYTVPTRSLETPERSLSRKLIFVAFPKIHFFTGDNQIFFGSSHNGRLLPEFFSDF
jgi:hypothetical protein